LGGGQRAGRSSPSRLVKSTTAKITSRPRRLGEEPAALSASIGQIIKERKRRVKTEVLPPADDGEQLTKGVSSEISAIISYRD